MKTYLRKADGCCYFLDKRGRLMAAPTLLDGSAALDVATYVDNFVHPPTIVEQNEIIAFLKA